jgi:hypothetical protein
MAATDLSTEALPSVASVTALAEMPFVVMAFSEFCLMVAVISSMEAETSSALAACSVEPWLMPWEAALIESEPWLMLPAPL